MVCHSEDSHLQNNPFFVVKLLKLLTLFYMKAIFQFRQLFLVGLISLLMGCSSDGSDITNNSTFFLKAKVDGQQVNMEGEYLCIYTVLPTGGYVITATNPNATELFTFTNALQALAVGTYNFQNSSGNLVTGQYVKNDISYTTAETTGGSLIITSYDAASKTLKGTFNFAPKDLNGTMVKNITDGSFSCKGIN